MKTTLTLRQLAARLTALVDVLPPAVAEQTVELTVDEDGHADTRGNLTFRMKVKGEVTTQACNVKPFVDILAADPVSPDAPWHERWGLTAGQEAAIAALPTRVQRIKAIRMGSERNLSLGDCITAHDSRFLTVQERFDTCATAIIAGKPPGTREV